MAVLNATEVQPNSDKRNEFLIVLDYLIHHTGDEKHATTQSEIVKYANKEYGVTIRRDRIPQILLHLAQLSEKYPDKLPFKLKTVMPKSANDDNDGARRKYYVSERAFTEKEILKIISAIQSDSTISASATKSLVDKFLKETACDSKVDSIKQKLEKKQRKTSKFTDRGMDYLEMLEELAINNERVWFSVKDTDDVDFDKTSFELRQNFRRKNEHYGHIYAVKEVNNKFIVIVYLSEFKRAMITPITNIVINSHLDLNDLNKSSHVDFALDDSKYASIDEWVEKHYKGQDGRLIEFVFKFTLDESLQKETEYITKTFEKQWKKKMEYTIKDREVERAYFDEEGNRQTETFTVQDAYVTIETTRESFRHWYQDFKIVSNVVIIKPAFLNDMWLAPLLSRLSRRITKYGSSYDYSLTRKEKPEYAEYLASRMKRLQERIDRIKVEGKDK